MVSVVVNSHARVNFDGNRYSVPPELARKTALLRAGSNEVRVMYQGRQWACHPRSYDRGQLIRHPDHDLAALQMRRRVRATEVEDHFDALGEEARQFHLELRRRPIKTSVHLRRLLKLVPVYGRQEVIAAIARAHEYQTYDAAYVETILLQDRRRRELPSPLAPRPKRQELVDDIHLEEPDPGVYDRLCSHGEEIP
jgi:hypothetical protein